MYYINDQFKEVRIGAFEVQLCLKSNNEAKVIVLHSKLETKQWPKIDVILNKIVSYMPFFKARIFVYQKDLEENEEDNNIEDNNIENQDMVNQGQENNNEYESKIDNNLFITKNNIRQRALKKSSIAFSSRRNLENDNNLKNKKIMERKKKNQETIE